MNSIINKKIASGKRKSSKATASIFEGSGIVRINGKNYQGLDFFKRLSIEEPIRIAKETLGTEKLGFDIDVVVRGGGKEGQIDAARLAIARAIVDFTKSGVLRKAFSSYDKALLVADVRRKEAYKPGDSKARSKRQKSYR